MDRTIKIPSKTKYLSQILTELPKDCIFNKGKIGGGGTTIALIDPFPTIICVPTVALIHNKVIQANENKYNLYPYKVLGIMDQGYVPTGGIVTQMFAEQDSKNFGKYFMNYIKECRSNEKPVKIVVTYDSLPKVMDEINPKDFNLLVDEYHMLFTEYSYRPKAAWAVLNNFSKFNHFTFMSSTPIEADYILKELKCINIVNAEWEDSTKINIDPICCGGTGNKVGSIKHTLSKAIQHCLAGGYGDTNLYIFVNEIRFINDLITSNKLKPHNCRVIYSMSNSKVKINNGIERGTTLDEPKKINFLTSTAFEGTDINDKNGWTLIVSDGANAYTLVDIYTKLPQIAGRVRNSRFQSITHIFKNTLYHNKKDEKQFLKEMDDRIHREKETITGLSETGNFLLINNVFNDKNPLRPIFYRYNEATKKIDLDENRININKWNWKLANNVYNVTINVVNEYKKADHKFGNIVFYDGVDNFEQTVRELDRKEHNWGEHSIEYMEYKITAFKAYPILGKIWDEFGFEWIKKKKFRQDNIQAYLEKQYVSTIRTAKLAMEISKNFKKGDVIPSHRAKEILSKIYLDLGISKRPAATHLANYFNIVKKTQRIKGSKPLDAIIIGSPITAIKNI